LQFLAELDRLRVVLVATRNPLNLGAAARAMSNFGASRLRVVNPFDLAFREARSAVGPAADILARAEVCDSVNAAIADCGLVVGTTAIQHRELQHSIHRLPEAATAIRQQLGSTTVAVLFGSEKTGLTNADLAHCHWLLHIPAREEHVSINLGQAVAVTLYELTRESKYSPTVEQSIADSAALERITRGLLEALQLSGYTKPENLTVTEEKVRRMIRRLTLDERDAEVLLGMLRQILWKLHSTGREGNSEED
jgi:tRNA/rRNA methyltransferase